MTRHLWRRVRRGTHLIYLPTNLAVRVVSKGDEGAHVRYYHVGAGGPTFYARHSDLSLTSSRNKLKH